MPSTVAPIVRPLRVLVALLLSVLVSSSASASVLECRMANGRLCHCTHALSDPLAPRSAHVHDSGAHVSRPGCCTLVEIARAQVPPVTSSLHVDAPAPALVQVAAVTLAHVELAPDVVVTQRVTQARVSTGPPIPIRLRHLLL